MESKLFLLFCAISEKLSSPAFSFSSFSVLPFGKIKLSCLQGKGTGSHLGGSVSAKLHQRLADKRKGFEEEVRRGYSKKEVPWGTADLLKKWGLSGPSVGPLKGDCWYIHLEAESLLYVLHFCNNRYIYVCLTACAEELGNGRTLH